MNEYLNRIEIEVNQSKEAEEAEEHPRYGVNFYKVRIIVPLLHIAYYTRSSIIDIRISMPLSGQNLNNGLGTCL